MSAEGPDDLPTDCDQRVQKQRSGNAQVPLASFSRFRNKLAIKDIEPLKGKVIRNT